MLILWAQNHREQGAEFYDLTDLSYATKETYVLNFTNNIVKGTITGATNVGYLMGKNSATVNDDGTNTTSGNIVLIQN